MIKLYVKELDALADTNVGVTASVVCKQGEYREIGVLLNQTLLESQTNILARHDDGSIRHALVTFLMDTTGQVDTIHTITLDPNQKRDAKSFPLPDMDFRDLAAKVEVVDSNDNVWLVDIPPSLGWPLVRTAGLRDAFSPRLKGNIGEEVEWRQPLKGIGGDHPQLSAVFRWRLYNKAKGARIEVVVENSEYPNMDDVNTKSISVWMGGQQRLHIQNQLFYAGQRMREIGWVGDRVPRLLVQQDATYLRELGAIPLIDTTQPLNSADVRNVLSGWLQNGKLDPAYPDGKHFTPCQITQRMANTGDRADIGPFPLWGLVTANSLDETAHLGQRSADGNGAGAFPVHLRNSNGEMGLGRHTHITKAYGGQSNPNKPDRAHQPCLGYISYLLTGERYYEEELAAWATYCTREWPWNVSLRYPGTRDSAWSLRAVTHAAWILPDNHEFKQYMIDTIEANLANWKVGFMDTVKYPLHTWNTGGWSGSGRANWTCAGRFSPWQLAWHVWSLYNTWKLLGYQDAQELFEFSCFYFQECYSRQIGATYTAVDGSVITWDPRFADQYSFAVSKHEPEIANGDWRVKSGSKVQLTNLAECLWYIHVNESWNWSGNNYPPFPAKGPAPENWLPNPPSYRKPHSTFEEYAMSDLAPAMQHAGIAEGDKVWQFIEPYVDQRMQDKNWPAGIKQVP